MTSTFTSAMENVTDEELERIAGGARANPRFQPAADHPLDHVDLLSIAVAASLGSPDREDSGGDGSCENRTWPLPSLLGSGH